MGLFFKWLESWFGIVRAASSTLKPNFKRGFQVDGTDYTTAELNAALGGGDRLVTGITAGATQTQVGATALTGEFNNITTVATAGDGVKLPTAVAGLRIYVRNGAAANTLAVWPATDDAIDAQSANSVGYRLPAGATVCFTAIDSTNWKSDGLVLDSVAVYAGANGTAGTIIVYPGTAAKGFLQITTADNTGDTTTQVSVAAQAAARTYGLPDWSTKASADTECSLAGIKVVADTTNRPGALGCLLYATGNNKLYVCTTASATAATWTIVGTQS
jgi:hypothetical protein